MPGVVAAELREQRLALDLIDAAVGVGSDGKAVAEIFGAAESAHQGLLLAGAGDADALEMLHGALTGARGFLRGDGVGEVAFKIDVLLLCFGGQCEVSVARDARVDLDEIGATGFDFVDNAAGVVGLFYDDGAGPDRRTAIDDDAGQVDFRRWLLAREFGAVSGASFFAGHDANSGDAIGDVQGQLVYIVNVDVHVPEAGDEEGSARVDGIR